MFDNIGGKLKGLAKVLCWTGILCSMIGAIGLWLANTRYQPTILSGFVLLIVGSLASWLGSFSLYGLGELIERVVSINDHLAALLRNSMAAPAYVAKPQSKSAMTQPNITRHPVIKEHPVVQQATVAETLCRADLHCAEKEQSAMQQDAEIEPRQIDSHYDEDDMQLLKTFREEGRLTEEEYQNCLANMKE